MIAVVSHDAGGAEILSSWLRLQKEPFTLVLTGPAVSVFKRKLGHIEIQPLDSAILSSDWVICGTSSHWQSDLERQAIKKSKNLGKKVVAFLDHWVNYEPRFIYENEMLYPDEIWVGDEYAQILAINTFPDVKIILKNNPYFEDLKSELDITKLKLEKNSNKFSVLYVCEPVREEAFLQYHDERYWGYTEEEAMYFFLKNIKYISQLITEINIRPHPLEEQSKYNWVKAICPLVNHTSSKKTLVDQIIESDIIVGCESMALVVGLLANKRVISCIPPGGKKCGLPQKNIESLEALIKTNA